MYCIECGTQVSEKAKFCPNCGTPVKAAAPPARPPEAPAETRAVPAASERPARVPKGAKRPAPQARVEEAEPQVAEKKARSQRRALTVRGILIRTLISGVIGFVLTFGMMFVNARWGEQLPFIGLWAVSAQSRAADYVEKYAPELEGAHVYVSAVYLNDQPFYVVDFIDRDPLQGLRVLVSRDLSQVWPYEYIGEK